MSYRKNDLSDQIFSSENAAKLAAKQKEIQQLGQSPEGQKVRKLLGGNANALQDAAMRGDGAALQEALSKILSTEEGARFAQQISDMMQ